MPGITEELTLYVYLPSSAAFTNHTLEYSTSNVVMLFSAVWSRDIHNVAFKDV